MIICILSNENTEKVLKVLKSIHCGRGIELDIYILYKENELLEYCVKNNVHVVIFGEKLGAYSGYEYACRLRMVDKNILPIIFMYNKTIDIQAGESELFGYLTDDNMENKLPKLIGYAAKRLRQDKGYLLNYRWNNQERHIELDEVLYFCSQHRIVEIMSMKGIKGTFYRKLDEVETDLQEQNIEFIRISKSFLINPQHILERSGQEIIMDNGERLSISRRYSKDIKV